jgi:hypothetical protein
MRFYTAMGKRALHVRKEVEGHVANRLQAALYREIAYLIDQGVVSVADADAAVCMGPGLRWALMGPNLIYHLGGGAGGIHHFLEHFTGSMTACWADLGFPDLIPFRDTREYRDVPMCEFRFLRDPEAWNYFIEQELYKSVT